MSATSPAADHVERSMHKRPIECQECGNAATIFTTNKEDIQFCPFCGEPLILDVVEPDDEDNALDMFDDDDWRIDDI